MAKEKISKKDVKKVSQLSKLELTQGEIENFTELFSDTLDYIKVLDELDISNIKETYQVTGLTNVFQGKDNNKTLSKMDALSNASEEIDGLFATKAVLKR